LLYPLPIVSLQENKGRITEIINNEKLLAENLAHEIHSQDDAADAGIRDIYMALHNYEEHLQAKKQVLNLEFKVRNLFF